MDILMGLGQVLVCSGSKVEEHVNTYSRAALSPDAITRIDVGRSDCHLLIVEFQRVFLHPLLPFDGHIHLDDTQKQGTNCTSVGGLSKKLFGNIVLNTASEGDRWKYTSSERSNHWPVRTKYSETLSHSQYTRPTFLDGLQTQNDINND